jgi:hypothetical protein
MLRERFLGVRTTLPSTSFLSWASETSPWVVRAYQMAPAIWPMSSSMVKPILIMVSQLSPDDCHGRRETKEHAEAALVLLVRCDGLHSAEALVERKRVRELLTQSRELLKQIEVD